MNVTGIWDGLSSKMRLAVIGIALLIVVVLVTAFVIIPAASAGTSADAGSRLTYAPPVINCGVGYVRGTLLESGVRRRAGAGTNTQIIGSFYAGQQICVQNSGGTWLSVEGGGYVAQSWNGTNYVRVDSANVLAAQVSTQLPTPIVPTSTQLPPTLAPTLVQANLIAEQSDEHPLVQRFGPAVELSNMDNDGMLEVTFHLNPEQATTAEWSLSSLGYVGVGFVLILTVISLVGKLRFGWHVALEREGRRPWHWELCIGNDNYCIIHKNIVDLVQTVLLLHVLWDVLVSPGLFGYPQILTARYYIAHAMELTVVMGLSFFDKEKTWVEKYAFPFGMLVALFLAFNMLYGNLNNAVRGTSITMMIFDGTQGWELSLIAFAGLFIEWVFEPFTFWRKGRATFDVSEIRHERREPPPAEVRSIPVNNDDLIDEEDEPDALADTYQTVFSRLGWKAKGDPEVDRANFHRVVIERQLRPHLDELIDDYEDDMSDEEVVQWLADQLDLRDITCKVDELVGKLREDEKV